jgi:hypothetical protein
LFIPQQLKVGYQERKDTYTGKLAYIIYLDQLGKVRKEPSWNSWRSKSIEPNDFNNEPTEGFVLNKKVGGYKSDWNHRATYTRVFDPRGFEFEITIPNLLFILENTNSIKGKGLEGEFVYGWEGTDLWLIPISSPDYKVWKQQSNVLFNKAFDWIKPKELQIGFSYTTNKGLKLIYMGRQSGTSYDNVKPRFVFIDPKESSKYCYVKHFASVNKLLVSSVEEIYENYVEARLKFEADSNWYKIDSSKTIKHYYTLEGFKEVTKELAKCYWNHKPKVRSDSLNSNEEIRPITHENELVYNCRWNGNYQNKQYTFETIEDFYNRIKPYWLEQYLTTGQRYHE